MGILPVENFSFMYFFGPFSAYISLQIPSFTIVCYDRDPDAPLRRIEGIICMYSDSCVRHVW